MGRLNAELKEMRKEIQGLRAQLASRKKDSSNSSKPPSSDIAKPPQKNASRQGRRGGQIGHAPQQRPAFEPGEIDDVKRYIHASCPQCGGPIEPLPMPAQVVQQVELIAKPILVTEHLSCTCHCAHCRQDFTQPIPPQIAAAGTFGPRLTAWVAYLKGACHASFRTIQQLLRETCGLKIAIGTLAKICQKVSRSLQPSYEALRQLIPEQTALHIDETGHRENGQRHWTWVFRAPQFTLFHIDPSRSANVLDQILGDHFTGTLLSDFYSAYRRYITTHPLASAQFCLSHLIRDVRYLDSLPNQPDRKYSAKLLTELKELFRLWHGREAVADKEAFRESLIAQGERLARVATEQAPDTKPSWNIARRFLKHERNYLRFTRVPGLEPTNNEAERAIRQVVIDRHVTQGTRSILGRNWCARIWTAIATCRQHGRELLSFLEHSFLALLTDIPPPLLIPPVNSR